MTDIIEAPVDQATDAENLRIAVCPECDRRGLISRLTGRCATDGFDRRRLIRCLQLSVRRSVRAERTAEFRAGHVRRHKKWEAA